MSGAEAGQPHASSPNTVPGPAERNGAAARHDAELLAAIDAALADSSGIAEPPPLLASAYQRYLASRRRVSVSQWLLSLLFVEAIGYLVDCFASPEHLFVLALTRLVAAPAALGALLLIWRRRARESVRRFDTLAVVSLSAIVLILSTATAARDSVPLHADRAFVTTFCICFLGTVIPSLTRRETLLYALIIETVFVAVMVWVEGFGLHEQLDMMIFTTATFALSATLRDGTDRARIRHFLRNERTDVMARQLARANFALAALNTDLQSANSRLMQLSTTDGLTGVANRRQLDTVLEAEWQRAAAGQEWLGLLMVDLDCFKSLNDTAGHERGDAALEAVACALVERTRKTRDLVARYGGDEFAVLLPGINRKAALGMAERMCETVRDLRLPHPTRGLITISVGAAACVPCLGGNAMELLQAADAALYSAKQAGRNAARLVTADEPDAMIDA